VLYQLITGRQPFLKTNRAELQSSIQLGIYEDPSCSPGCKDLISKMICTDLAMRFSADQCLNHPWIKQMHKEDINAVHAIQVDVVKKLRQFRGETKLKKAALRIFVKTISDPYLEKLREQFQLFDTSGDGVITN
jgi:calcium-dependent protein kinase